MLPIPGPEDLPGWFCCAGKSWFPAGRAAVPVPFAQIDSVIPPSAELLHDGRIVAVHISIPVHDCVDAKAGIGTENLHFVHGYALHIQRLSEIPLLVGTNPGQCILKILFDFLGRHFHIQLQIRRGQIHVGHHVIQAFQAQTGLLRRKSCLL